MAHSKEVARRKKEKRKTHSSGDENQLVCLMLQFQARWVLK